jgi:hypothetical protein
LERAGRLRFSLNVRAQAADSLFSLSEARRKKGEETKSMRRETPMTLSWRTGAAAALTLLAGACETLGGRQSDRWLEVTHVENRFNVYVDQANPRMDDQVAFRLVYVYAPDAVKFEGKDVGWQEYPAVVVNCADNKVKLGPRTRHAPDGTLLFQDDDQSFTDINVGTAVEAAARARCEGDRLANAHSVRDGEGWMAEARAHIAEGAMMHTPAGADAPPPAPQS